MEERYNQHLHEAKKGSENHFHKAIRKYGEDTWDSEILEDNIESLDEANEKEIYYIQKFDTFNAGYNMTLGGNLLYSSTKGKTYEEIYGSEEKIIAKKKAMGDAQRGIPMSEESKQKMKDNHWSKKGIKNDWSKQPPHKEETKKAISESLKKYNESLTEEERNERYKHNKGKNHPNYGKKRTEETKRKISEAAKLKIECPHCHKMTSRGVAKRWHFDNCKLKKENNES